MKDSYALFSRVRLVAFVLLASLIALFGFYIIGGFWIRQERDTIQTLSAGWEISLNDVPLEEDRIAYAVESAA